MDRPAGKAGGTGSGFNGGELLALAIGGCLCNDLQYAAHEMSIDLTSIAVDIEITFDGEPMLATSASVTLDVSSSDPDAAISELVRKAIESSTVSNSLKRGFEISTALRASSIAR